ncbi:class I SAM-dependent methyltransferase [Aeromicrobium ginsengisoli]|uniref:Methyltransferase domain-containing protein n=1 Tax=Aeromicrobium ginsengisoli TaxID=363867 RepID=A0A5M4FJ58_9ACTN|nr:class I SAM-dependent methyltransferase [Aeromicrobium ginsengisoli]KAA1400249.1 methyltransferase domain-containing protein [Aeromicrobium ginsengisoli]
MALWTDRILPHLVDKSLSTGDVMKARERVCAGLTGRVIELGFGSGLNIEKYPDAVESLAAVEPSDVAWGMSADRRAVSRTPITRSGLDGQSLDEPDGAFDAALSTFTLCTIPDVEQALREVHRVLRPGGTFHFLEHGLAPQPEVVRWQRRMEPVQKSLAGGCHLTRDIPELVRSAGFEITELEQRYLLGPKLSRPWTYVHSGAAVRR